MTKQTKEKTQDKVATHRMWLYKGAEAKLFNKGDVIPAGYKDAPKAD